MWFLLGFTTLFSFAIYFGIKLRQSSWKGQIASDGVLSYEFLFTKVEKRVKAFDVAVTAPRVFDFAFKREQPIDRFCKFVGLSVEHQVGFDKFDKLVYVVSNDNHFLRNVVGGPRLIESAVKLFGSLRHECKVSAVRCANGRLWARVEVDQACSDDANLYKLQEVMPHVARLLVKISEQLGQNLPEESGSIRDRFIYRAAILLAISTALFVNGVAHSLRVYWDTDQFTVDSDQLWLWSACGGGFIVALLVASTLLLLGRSARTHLVLIEILMVGSIGSTLTTFTALRDMNMEWDKSSAEVKGTRIVDKNTSTSRRGGRRHFVVLQAWSGQNSEVEVRVDGDFYSNARVGDDVRIRQRRGYLDVSWVQSYEHIKN